MYQVQYKMNIITCYEHFDDLMDAEEFARDCYNDADTIQIYHLTLVEDYK